MPDDEIRRLVEAYFNALDRRDLTGIGRCFAADAKAVYYVGTSAEVSFEGREAILRQLATVIARFAASIHILANASYEVSGRSGLGRSGLAQVHAVANVVMGDVVLVRGLRYTIRVDELTEGWRIAELRHHQLFQTEAVSVPPGIPDARE